MNIVLKVIYSKSFFSFFLYLLYFVDENLVIDEDVLGKKYELLAKSLK